MRVPVLPPKSVAALSELKKEIVDLSLGRLRFNSSFKRSRKRDDESARIQGLMEREAEIANRRRSTAAATATRCRVERA